MFNEGLATFVMLPEFLRTQEKHLEYMGNIPFWEGAVEGVKSDNEETIKKAISDAVDDKGFRRLNPKVSERLRKEIDSEDVSYSKAFFNIFYENNGPIYHLGYNMWNEIAKKYGQERVKQTVLNGPKELVSTYKGIRN